MKEMAQIMKQKLQGSTSTIYGEIVETLEKNSTPIVPSVGGPIEFVPRNFHFNSLEKAAGEEMLLSEYRKLL